MNQTAILDCINNERLKQDAQHGKNVLSDLEFYAILGEEFGEAGRALCHAHVPPIDNSIVKAAVDNLEYELIQIAAVCVAWIEQIRERKRDE